MPHRRGYLALLAGSVSVGCLGDETTDRSEFNESFSSTLESGHQLDLVTTRWEDDVFIVEHRAGPTRDSDVGDVAGGFASIHDVYDVEPAHIEGRVVENGDVVETYTVDLELAEAYANEEIDETTFVEEVLDTYQET